MWNKLLITLVRVIWLNISLSGFIFTQLRWNILSYHTLTHVISSVCVCCVCVVCVCFVCVLCVWVCVCELAVTPKALTIIMSKLFNVCGSANQQVSGFNIQYRLEINSQTSWACTKCTDNQVTFSNGIEEMGNLKIMTFYPWYSWYC